MSWLPQPNICGFNHHGNWMSVYRKPHMTHTYRSPFFFLSGDVASSSRSCVTWPHTLCKHWKQVWVDRAGFRAQQGRHGSGGLVLVAGRQKLPKARWQIWAWLYSCRTRSPTSSWQTTQGSSSHEQRNESIEHVWFILDKTNKEWLFICKEALCFSSK